MSCALRWNSRRERTDRNLHRIRIAYAVTYSSTYASRNRNLNYSSRYKQLYRFEYFNGIVAVLFGIVVTLYRTKTRSSGFQIVKTKTSSGRGLTRYSIWCRTCDVHARLLFIGKRRSGQVVAVGYDEFWFLLIYTILLLYSLVKTL